VYLLCESPRLALADFDEVIRTDPDNADGYNGRGYARVLLGRCREALADAEEALRRADAAGPGAARTLYNTARIYAQVAGKLGTGPEAERGLPPGARREYQERALGLIRKALERMPPEQRAAFWRDRVQTDPALAPVRTAPGFARLKAYCSRPTR
jgi:tetratricopeptide (TPR) repeat protein